MAGNKLTGATRENTEGGTPVFSLVKSLFLSYLLTAGLLMLLALLLYKLRLGEGVVNIAITVIYVAATLLAGFLAGKKMQSRKFLWGLMEGCAYFAVMALISLFVNRSGGVSGDSFCTTLIICAAGGMLGGMLS